MHFFLLLNYFHSRNYGFVSTGNWQMHSFSWGMCSFLLFCVNVFNERMGWTVILTFWGFFLLFSFLLFSFDSFRKIMICNTETITQIRTMTHWLNTNTNWNSCDWYTHKFYMTGFMQASFPINIQSWQWCQHWHQRLYYIKTKKIQKQNVTPS